MTTHTKTSLSDYLEMCGGSDVFVFWEKDDKGKLTDKPDVPAAKEFRDKMLKILPREHVTQSYNKVTLQIVYQKPK